MHLVDPPSEKPESATTGPWWRELNRYHWFVLIVAALGWLFDCLDQQLFLLARPSAMRELVVRLPGETDAAFGKRADGVYGTWATSIFLVGWAAGGLVFGVLGDRIGRARTMLLTILMYSLCTGLSALSVGFWDFAFYRFITGMGIGGEFAVGVALVAEVMPDRARPFALGLLQALSAIGNVTAALIVLTLGELETRGVFQNFVVMGYPVGVWRIVFVVGTLPALLALVIRSRLKEPEKWSAVARAGKLHELGSLSDLMGDNRWRRNVVIGLVLAVSGQIGLWGIGFYFPELTRSVFESTFRAQGLTGDQLKGQINVWKAITSVFLNVGAFFGIYAFSRVTHHLGRKPTFALCFVLALLSTLLVFSSLSTFSDIFWMIPLMGFCQLSLFGGYAIYFPELFPTRLRSTGTSFCYNVGRLITATGPLMLGLLITQVYVGYEGALPYRYAGMTMCAVFLLGLLVLPFAPETRGQPLPE